jgi:hypothetical protein
VNIPKQIAHQPEELSMRYRVKPHEVTAIQWRGDNRDEVREFLTGIGAAEVKFEQSVRHELSDWDGVCFDMGGDDGWVWCDRGEWVVVFRPDAHELITLPDEDFRRDFEPA